MKSAVLAGIVAGSVVTLFGCGGSDDDGSGGDPGTSTPAPSSGITSATTTSTTTSAGTTVAPSDESPCKVGNEEACVKWLNELYMGYDESDPLSPLGVSLHGEPSAADWPWFYLTGECYNANVDGYASASLMNHKVMITPNGMASPMMESKLFVIYQPFAAEHQITKCAYQYDGSAWNKFHGGCGSGASRDCNSSTSAFHNKCPEDETKYADDACPSVQRALCDTEALDYPAQCSWRGPAWFSPSYDGATADLSRVDEVNEVRNMVEQRMVSQSSGNMTNDGITLTEFWNELTLDGRVMQKLLDEDATQVIAGFGYLKGDPVSMSFAKNYSDNLFKAWQKRVPLVAMNFSANVSAGDLLFAMAEVSLLSEQLV